MKKIIALLTIALILFSGVRFTLATETLTYEKAQELAEQYIKNSLDDELWKDNNPIISKGTYFYTDNEDTPSYIEFKVSCNDTKDCGFIIVNIDGDDVAIPISSPAGIGPSEILLSQIKDISKNNVNDNKFYYFSPFEQYLENQTTRKVISINQEDNVDFQLNSYVMSEKMKIKQDIDIRNGVKLEESIEIVRDKSIDESKELNLSQEEFFEKILRDYETQNAKSMKLNGALSKIEINDKQIEEKRIELENSLRIKLEESKNSAKEFKKSDEFKQQKELIKEQILFVPNEKFAMKNLDMSFAAYNPGTNISNVFVSGVNASSSSGCSGKTPCYNQMFNTTYNGINCTVAGCAPTSLGIIYGYYAINNRYTLFPNSNNAGWINNTNANAVIYALGQLMSTQCTTTKPGIASTTPANIPSGINYPKVLGYTNSTSTLYTGGNNIFIFTGVKNEINANRPILINAYKTTSNDGHTFVGYGYKSTTGTEKIARINAGVGKLPVDDGTAYYYSSIDHNLDAMYLGASGTYKSSGYVMFNIQ